MAEVLFEVDDVLGDHDRVLDVVLHPFKALDTLLTSVPEEINQDLSMKIQMEKIFKKNQTKNKSLPLLNASQTPIVWHTCTAPSMK